MTREDKAKAQFPIFAKAYKAEGKPMQVMPDGRLHPIQAARAWTEHWNAAK